MIIKVSNMVGDKDIYVVDYSYIKGTKNAIVFYLPFNCEVYSISNRYLDLEKLLKFLRRSKIEFHVMENGNHVVREIQRNGDPTYYEHLTPLVVALLLTIEDKEPTPTLIDVVNISIRSKRDNEITDKCFVNHEVIKSVLLSASKINFYKLQAISIPYDTVWATNEYSDFSNLFTKEEARKIYEKVFIPDDRAFSTIALSPGWVKLFLKAASFDEVYENYVSKADKVVLNFLKEEPSEYKDVISKLIFEKTPMVKIKRANYWSILPNEGYASPTMITLELISLLQDDYEELQKKSGCYFTRSISFKVNPDDYDEVLSNLKAYVKKHFLESPFLVQLFFSTVYVTACHEHTDKKKELISIFLNVFLDFLSSLPDKVLKEQKFREVNYLWPSYFTEALLTALNEFDKVNELAKKCLLIKNFPLEIFLLRNGIRKCEVYQRLVSKVASSDQRFIGYIVGFWEAESLDLNPDEAVYSDLVERASLKLLQRVLDKKYVIRYAENKLKLMSVMSESDRINVKRNLILNELGRYRGTLPEALIRVLKENCKVETFYDFIKFTRKVAEQTTEEEFDVFAKMMSEFFGLSQGSSYLEIKYNKDKDFLRNADVDYVLSLIKKIKNIELSKTSKE